LYARAIASRENSLPVKIRVAFWMVRRTVIRNCNER